MTDCRRPRAGLFLLLALLLLVAVGGCSREPTPALRIGTNVWIGSEPLYLARELGHLPPEAVRLVEYPSASEVLRAYRNQALDGMVISLDEVLVLAADGLAPRIVAVVDVSHGADVVIGRAGLRTMRDLQGKRVAVESGALGAYVLSRALTLNNMQPGDVHIVHLESNEHPAAFEQGQVDAAVTFDPFRSRMLKAGANTLFDSTRIPGEIVDLLVVRDSVLAHNPGGVSVLLSGWFKAIEYLEREPADAAGRMSVRQQTSGEQFLQTLKGLRFPPREENLKMIAGPMPALASSGGLLMGLMLEAKLLEKPVEVGSLLAPDPLQRLPP
jgi:NitT/TauT family transport system substrate-binding protein